MENPIETQTTTNQKQMSSSAPAFVPSSTQAIQNELAAIQKKGDVEMEGDDLVFNPYNPNNVEITESDVLAILEQYSGPTKINNFALYRRAFIHRSYTRRPDIENSAMDVVLSEKPDDCLPLSTKSNERLEFLGDGVLELIVKYYLYRRFPKEDEGFMTEKKIALVKNEHIGKLAQAMGLDKWFIISRHAEEKNTRNNLKKLGCLFEAFIGALFLDHNKFAIDSDDNRFSQMTEEDDMFQQGHFITGHGFNYAQKFVEAVLEKEVDWNRLICFNDNFKNQLQVRVQKAFKTTPHYLLSNFDEITGEVTMVVCVCLNQQIYETSLEYARSFTEFGSFDEIINQALMGDPLLVILGQGSHKVKKNAEQRACADALHHIPEASMIATQNILANYGDNTTEQ